jgi:hypothetical protein
MESWLVKKTGGSKILCDCPFKWDKNCSSYCVRFRIQGRRLLTHITGQVITLQNVVYVLQIYARVCLYVCHCHFTLTVCTVLAKIRWIPKTVCNGSARFTIHVVLLTLEKPGTCYSFIQVIIQYTGCRWKGRMIDVKRTKKWNALEGGKGDKKCELSGSLVSLIFAFISALSLIFVLFDAFEQVFCFKLGTGTYLYSMVLI